MADVYSPAGWTAEPDLHVAKLQVRAARPISARLSKTIGMTAPKPNREVSRPGLSCAAIAPGEWLLVGGRAEVDDVLERVRGNFADDLFLAVDLTAGRYASRFSGLAALAFLSAYSPVDFSANAFAVGSAARTQLGDIGIFVTKLDDQPTFRLIIEQSMTPYFHNLLWHSRSAG